LHAEREGSDITTRESLDQSFLDNSVAYAVIENILDNILVDIEKCTSLVEEAVKVIGRDWRKNLLICMWFSL
jgi:hypothetical protein